MSALGRKRTSAFETVTQSYSGLPVNWFDSSVMQRGFRHPDLPLKIDKSLLRCRGDVRPVRHLQAGDQYVLAVLRAED